MKLTLSPAYGRDYKSVAEVKEAFNANKDFVIETFFHPSCGRLVNRSQLVDDGHREVFIRYSRLTKVANIKV